MHALFRLIKYCAALPFVILAALPALSSAQEPSTYDDPFYKQKGTDQIIAERSVSPFQKVQESVDPFTGNLNLLNTDV